MLQAAGDGCRSVREEGPGRVDAVVGDQGVDPVKVGRRDAEPGASARAVGDDASDPVRPPEEPGGLGGRAFGQGLANPGRRDDPAADRRRRGDLEVEPGLGAPAARSSASPPRSRPKTKFGPSTIPRAPNWPRTTRSKNSRAVRPEQPGAGPEDADLGGPGALQKLDLALGPGQRGGGLVGSQQGDRGGSNVSASGRGPGGVGPGPEPGDQVGVASVDAVEVADRENAPRSLGGYSGEISIVITDPIPPLLLLLPTRSSGLDYRRRRAARSMPAGRAGERVGKLRGFLTCRTATGYDGEAEGPPQVTTD